MAARDSLVADPDSRDAVASLMAAQSCTGALTVALPVAADFAATLVDFMAVADSTAEAPTVVDLAVAAPTVAGAIN
jgi:hypothetical protein